MNILISKGLAKSYFLVNFYKIVAKVSNTGLEKMGGARGALASPDFQRLSLELFLKCAYPNLQISNVTH